MSVEQATRLREFEFVRPAHAPPWPMCVCVCVRVCVYMCVSLLTGRTAAKGVLQQMDVQHKLMPAAHATEVVF